MNNQKFINNFRTTVASTFGAGDTLLQLTSVAGLPVISDGDYYTLTLFRLSGIEESGYEVVKVTERTGNQCTVQRSYEGAAASQFLAGSIVECRLTGKAMDAKADKTALIELASSMGTAAGANIPFTGNAAPAEVVKGSDTRLSDARTPTSHSHTLAQVTPGGGSTANDIVVISPDNLSVTSKPVSDIFKVTYNRSAAAPNATIPAHQILAAGTEANIDMVISSKGTGATLAQIPDSTTTGGNKRGIYATDWQKSRSNSAHVASGNYSVVSGGQNNRSTGINSFVGGGKLNNVGGSYAAIVCGESNLASAQYSSVGGGTSNNAAGDFSVIGGGAYNQALSYMSAVPGGIGASSRGVQGAMVWAGAVGNNIGSIGGGLQKADYLLTGHTTGATPFILATVYASSGDPAPDATNQVALPDSSSFLCTIRMTARNSASGGIASWTGTALFTRGVGEATTVKVSGTLAAFATSGLTLGVPTILADTTFGCIKVTVTGIAATDIHWLCHIDTLETSTA